MNRLNNSDGFTLVELMLSMTLFVSVLVISTAGFIAMNRTFTRGTIKRQLSEAVQMTTEDVTRSVRQIPQSSAQPLYCPSADSLLTRDPTCPTTSDDWNTICLVGSRYVWKSQLDAGGLWRESKDCAESVDVKDAIQLVNERYKVVGFEINSVGNPNVDSLFRIKGTFRTIDDSAFNDPASANNVKCKGSVASSAVRTCAVERFDFIINIRGQI